MKKYSLAVILGCAVLAAIPASASTANFNFISCSGTGSTGLTATTCNSDLGGYGTVASTGLTGANATVTAYFVQGTTSGPTGGDTLQTGEVGAYSGAGLGDCETQSGTNCSSPQHQIDNGINPSSGNNVNTPYDFEFLLVQFTGAVVNLSDIQLGNFGGGATNPFYATYFTSSATSLTTALTSMTYSTLLAGGTAADGFTAASTSCTAGTNKLDQTTQSTLNSNCTTEAIDSVSGSNVTYLLIGASTSSSQVGDDYFKLQDIDASSINATISGTPEPATFGLIGLALAGLGIVSRKRKAQNS